MNHDLMQETADWAHEHPITRRVDAEAFHQSEREAAYKSRGFAACRSDACARGRQPCPTPDACQLPEPERGQMSQVDRITRVLLLFASATISVCVIWFGLSALSRAMPPISLQGVVDAIAAVVPKAEP